MGALFSQDKKEVKAFIMHNLEAGNFDENAIMIPANAKMNKMGKAPKDLPYATSLKKLYCVRPAMAVRHSIRRACWEH